MKNNNHMHARENERKIIEDSFDEFKQRNPEFVNEYLKSINDEAIKHEDVLILLTWLRKIEDYFQDQGFDSDQSFEIIDGIMNQLITRLAHYLFVGFKERVDSGMSNLSKNEKLNYLHRWILEVEEQLEYIAVRDLIRKYEIELSNDLDKYLLRAFGTIVKPHLLAHLNIEYKYLKEYRGEHEDDVFLQIESPKKIGQIVLLLEELGVLNYLAETYKIKTHSKIAQIVSLFTKENAESLRSYIRALHTSDDNKNDPRTKENMQWVNDTFHRLKLIKIRES